VDEGEDKDDQALWNDDWDDENVDDDFSKQLRYLFRFLIPLHPSILQLFSSHNTEKSVLNLGMFQIRFTLAPACFAWPFLYLLSIVFFLNSGFYIFIVRGLVSTQFPLSFPLYPGLSSLLPIHFCRREYFCDKNVY
jgi:hypothetical protein